jgi:hypothetical protein
LIFFHLFSLSNAGRTGLIELDAYGVRMKQYCVLHFQEGAVIKVAELSSGYLPLTKLDWPGGQVPSDSFDDRGEGVI